MSSRPALARSLAALLIFAPSAGLAQQPATTVATPAATTATTAPPAAAKPATLAAVATVAMKSPAKALPLGAKAKGAVAARNAKKKKARQDSPVTGPIVTYPGFRLLDGGVSRISVALSQKVAVSEQKGDGKLTYRIQGVQVPTSTNRLPLLTTFFKTPVSRIALVEHDSDVELVIDLRSASTAQFRIVESDRGAELQVDFPRPADEATDEPASAAPIPGAVTTAPAAADAAQPVRRTKNLESPKNSSY